MVFLYIKKIHNENIAFISYLLTLSSPYLVNLSLSMLSDSMGLFFLFLSLYLMEDKKYKLSGLMVSIALFARPSYLILFLITFIYLMFLKKESLKKIFISFFITSVFFLLYIFAYNGELFIIEGIRFTQGHFSLWGIGQNSDVSWYLNIFNLSNIPFLFLFFIKFDKKYFLLYLLFIGYFIWIIFAQNPENLRHLVPIVLIASILVSPILDKYKFLLFVTVVFNIYTIFSYTNILSPIDQIIKDIKKDKNSKRIIISNRSIEILKSSLENKVFDKYYINSAIYYINNKSSYEISTSVNGLINFKIYKGRFIGERKYYISKINDN